MFIWTAIAILAVLIALQFDPKRIKRRIRAYKYSRKGVIFIDPSKVYIAKNVEIGAGTTIYPNVYLYEGTTIGKNCTIWPNVNLSNVRIGNHSVIWSGANLFDSMIGDHCVIWPNVSTYKARIRSYVTIHSHNRIVNATIKSGGKGKRTVIESYSLPTDSIIEGRAKVGPFAYVRDGSYIGAESEVANIEIVRSRLQSNVKAKHGRYIGDARIGKGCNIGAGTVFCNYDGMEKHVTILEDDVFVGSGTMLVAPLTLGEESITGAGSVVSRDVPPNTLAIERGQPHTHHEWQGKIQKGGGAVHKAGRTQKTKKGWSYK
ncbi:MAG: DapH/DapD/GlmU-related protein [Candidatus Spechtbacterales bacterium]|nr:DapH/DapD/GlmU-related protein [Candidatus Spechtbacterales bacterium]